MEIEALKELIESSYCLKVLDLIKIKNVYRIIAKDGEYCLKVISYDFPHFYFILSAILHLQKRNFHTIPNIIKKNDGCSYLKIGNKYGYLTPWVICRESNYDNPVDLINAAVKLGEMHKCSEGFTLNEKMKPRIYWFSWLNTFNTRGKEILDFKQRISQKAHKSEFDNLYLALMKDELERVERSIDNLKKSNYYKVMEREVLSRGFCHHDYAHHNVLVDNNNNINLIDFDYCILDSRLHDLCSLAIRTMKDGKWSVEKFNLIIEAYSTISFIDEDEVKIMTSFMEFPQNYWQLGIQYYWEQQPWGEEFFVKKLVKYQEDRELRQEVICKLRKF